MRKKPGKREREARKRRKSNNKTIVYSSTRGGRLNLGSKKFQTYLRDVFFVNHSPVVDAEIMTKSCAGVHP